MRKVAVLATFAVLALAAPFAESVAGSQADGTAAEQAEQWDEGRQEQFNRGWTSFQRYCRTCHGETGKGDGSVGEWLKVPPSDLSQLSERNDGVFPLERVVRVLDGRDEVGLHGRRDMPIWGQVFRDTRESDDPEKAVTEQIAELVAVLKSLDRPAGGR